MSIEEIFRLAGIPLLVFVVCVYYGVRLFIFRDISVVLSKTGPAVKDEKIYVKEAGKLLVLFSGATLLMTVLLFYSIYIAFAEICISIVIVGVLWKRLNDKYGA